MIEMMLEAERALAVGLLDQAEGLYRQVVAADPHNAIAVVGLARVALERGDQRTTYVEANRALAMDPDNPMASHLAMRMSEILRGRGESLPELPSAAPGSKVASSPAMAQPSTDGKPPADASSRPGIVGRLLRRHR